MTTRKDPDAALKAFVRAHASRPPWPEPGHVERAVSRMRARHDAAQRWRVTLEIGTAAAALAASLLLYFVTRDDERRDAERILAESFASVIESPAEADDPGYEPWLP